MIPRVGEPAPDFALEHRPAHPPVRLSDHRGRPVVLLFFPLAFSGVCTQEICTVVEDFAQWSALGVTVFGISVDSSWVNLRFARECGADFPILSDFNREACTAYGIRNDDFFGMRGVSDRSVFVIDAEGRIAWAWTSPDADVLPDFHAVRSAVEGLGTTR